MRRGAGLIDAARDLVALAFGRRADGRSRSIGGAIHDGRTYVRAIRAHRAGRTRQAAVAAETILVGHPDLYWPLRIVSSNSARHGEPSASLAAVRRLRGHRDSAALRRREEELVARLQETEPAWLPDAGPAEAPVEPRSPDAIMHLLKTSLPDRQSGYTIRSREVLRAQVGVGLEPFVVTPFGFPPPRGHDPIPAMEWVDGIAHHRLDPGAPTDRLTSGELLSRTATLAAAVARRERPALIHAASGHRGYENALIGVALRDRLRLPLVYEVRGFFETSWSGDAAIAETAGSAELTRRRYATEARVMAAADGIATLGQAMRDELVGRGVPAEKIVVVPNGIDPEAFSPVAPDPDARRRHGLEGRWVFGYVSNMDHFREGHALLIEATARLQAAGRSVACVLVGDGLLREKLEAQARAAGVASSVVFTGRVPHDEVQAAYSLLDAFVIARVPDRAARFVTPLKPYEAMAMAIPVVVSDLPALVEIAEPDRRGLSFTAGDADDLVAQLIRLMDDPALGRRLTATARDWVLTERTWAADGPRYRELYARARARFDDQLRAGAGARPD